MTGTTRYTQNLYQGLKQAGIEVNLAFPVSIPVWPPIESGLKRLKLDLMTFFESYPIKIKPGIADIFHLTTQTFAILLMTNRFKAPVVVSVLDIIPYLVRRNLYLNTFRHPLDFVFYRFSLAGLKRASALVAISEYSKRTLVETLGLPDERIHVIHPQIDQVVFKPHNVPNSFLERYGLNRNNRYILHVGTNDPRKNLCTLVQAFYLLKQEYKNIKLIRVGSDPFIQESQRLIRLIAQLDLSDDVQFFANVSDEDLANFYNLSELFVFPSLYEGFGIPVLEAMACGTPVICSRATSLPEVGGDATRYIDPKSAEGLATALVEVLEDRALQHRMRQQGLIQVGKFDGIDTIESIKKVYSELSDKVFSTKTRLSCP